MTTLKLLSVVLLLLCLTASDVSVAQRAAAASESTARAVKAADAFLRTLDEARRSRANVSLDVKARAVWSNLPTGVTLQTGATERNGVKLGELTTDQQAAALALVAATLSPTGYQKVLSIVNGDEILEKASAPGRQAGSRVRFGRGEYYVSILGTPSPMQPWMLQFGGHHLAINITVAGDQNVLTPSHTGAQPATYSFEGRTIRPLGNENDKAFALMNALDAAQQKQALLGYQVRNIVLGPGEDGRVIQPEGIRVSSFAGKQQEMLLDLVGEWVGILNDESAKAKMAEVKANLDHTWFAWSGSTTNGKGAYFRIQGPTVVIEYAPQGQAGSDTDHIHTMFRDPTNDYAAKVSRR